MKKLFSIIVLLAGVISFTACSSDDTENPYASEASISVKSADVLFEPAGGTGTIEVVSETPISVTASTSWVATSVSGNTITVSVPTITTSEGRSARLTIKNAREEVTVTVQQKGLVFSIGDANEIEVSGASSDLAVSVLSSEGVGVSVASQNDWITATYDAETDQITIHVDANTVEDPREGSITVTSQDVTETIIIKQGGIALELETDNLVITSGTAQTVNVNVVRSIDVEATSDADWVTPTFNATRNRLEVKVDALGSEVKRSATVTVTSGSLTRELTVTQYDFYGDYYLVFTDGSNNQLAYYEATIDANGLSYDYMAGLTLTWPVKNTGDYEVTVGPAGTPIGSYGTSYYFFAAWANSEEGIWSTYDGEQSVVGEVIHEENTNGILTQYLDNFKGTLDGGQEIDSWLMWGCNKPEFSSNNHLGYFDWLIEPYLMKIPASANQARSRNGVVTKSIRTRDGREAMPAVLRNILRPKEVKAIK